MAYLVSVKFMNGQWNEFITFEGLLGAKAAVDAMNLQDVKYAEARRYYDAHIIGAPIVLVER